MPKFFVVALFGLAFNTAIMALMTEIWKVYYLIAQVLATAAVTLVNAASWAGLSICATSWSGPL